MQRTSRGHFGRHRIMQSIAEKRPEDEPGQLPLEDEELPEEQHGPEPEPEPSESSK